MLKHVHDLKNELREKGWYERDKTEVYWTFFLGVKTQVQNLDLSLNETDLYLLTLLLPPYTFWGFGDLQEVIL